MHYDGGNEILHLPPRQWKEHVAATLAARSRRVLPSGPVPASVLLPLFLRNGEFHVLFSKRTDNLHHHRGEICFPGGAADPEDDDSLATALRETEEELGIPPSEVEPLGTLDDFYSIHNYNVTPHVGIIPPDFPFRINVHEIERLIVAPLSHFLDPSIFRTEDWSWKGRSSAVCFFRYGDDEIWGLTAAILKQFLDLALGAQSLMPLYTPTQNGA